MHNSATILQKCSCYQEKDCMDQTNLHNAQLGKTTCAWVLKEENGKYGLTYFQVGKYYITVEALKVGVVLGPKTFSLESRFFQLRLEKPAEHTISIYSPLGPWIEFFKRNF